MALTWSILSGHCNGEGNLIRLRVEVSAPVGQITIPDWEKAVAWMRDPANDVESKIYSIVGWRFNEVQGRLFERDDDEAADPGIDDAEIIEFDRALSDVPGTSNKAFRFTLAIVLRPSARIATENAQGNVFVSELHSNSEADPWLLLEMSNLDPVEQPAPTMNVAGHPRMRLETGNVGKILNHHAYVYGNACAEWVRRDRHAALDPLPDLLDQSLRANSLATASAPVLDADEPVTDQFVPFVQLGDSADTRLYLPNPPMRPRNITIAVTLIPTGDDMSDRFIIGQYNSGDPATGESLDQSWKLTYTRASGTSKLTYTTMNAAQTTASSIDLPLDEEDEAVVVVFRRDQGEGEESDTYSCWINGRLIADGISTGLSDDVAEGGGPLTVGVRGTTSAWVEPFPGRVNDIGLFAAPIDNYKVALQVQQMACRAGIKLGTPIADPTQPYGPGGGAPAERVLDRRPIAVITLVNSQYADNVFGQSTNWRPTSGTAAQKQAAVEDWLRGRIREILLANDQYEIMFNRPGGKYDEDIVPSYVFGWSPASLPPPNTTDTNGAVPMVEDYQWAALKAIFDEFNLDSYNDRGDVNDGGYTKRRAWFYTGAGIPLNDDGSLNTHGYMHNRSIGPVSGKMYYNLLLNSWPAKDDRYRCLFLDASSGFYGLFVQALGDPVLTDELTLVGEAIPTDEAGRRGAPWFSLVRYNRAPWWKIDQDETPPVPSSSKGYDWNWSTDPRAMPTYFGVISNGAYAILDGSDARESGNDMTFAQACSWVMKGATPVAWNGGFKKLGDAWNVGTGRVMPSRQDRSMRVIRGARV